MKKIVSAVLFQLLVLLVTISVAYAQEANSGIEMADTMRSEGKIYVVVLVVIILFSGLVFYAFNTDQKLSKVEKEIENLKSEKDS